MRGRARAVRRLALAGVLALAVPGCAVAPRVAPPPAPTPAPTPTPTAAPTPEPAVVPEPAITIPVRDDVRPPVVRVLLQVGVDPALPEPGRRYVASVGGAMAPVRGPISARALPGRAAIQVGAFAQDASVEATLVRLGAFGLDARSEVQRDGLRRVIVLASEGETGDALSQRLVAAGFADQKRVGAGYGGRVTAQGEGGEALEGEVIRLVPVDPAPVRVGAKSVRGEIELRAGLDGLSIINVVSLEEYLRGVVPGEMGPRTFPLIDALKAQAVAARTYAVAHLGDHAFEGYDLCDAPSCQVYDGAGAEQPLTDRAVQETAGEILVYQGRPIDAMYHSTCAGHTEDAVALFPQRAEPYLKGVACRGERTLAAGHGGKAGPWLPAVGRLTVVAEALARSLDVTAAPRSLAGRLAGTPAGPGAAGIVRAFGLDAVAATLGVPAVQGSEEGTLELLRTFRLPLGPPPRSGSLLGWELALVVRLAQLGGKVQATTGRLVPGPQGVRFVGDGPEAARDLTGREAVLERRGERWRVNFLSFPSGSAATLWCASEICPIVEVEPLEQADAASAWAWWARELSLEEIARRLGVPGARQVDVLRRGVSGRALAVNVVGSGGAREFGGLAFRRALDLPDTLFVALRSGTASQPAIRFLGRGWGHGVGLCQNGAYGLARGGAGYREILGTYYTGVEVAKMDEVKP